MRFLLCLATLGIGLFGVIGFLVEPSCRQRIQVRTTYPIQIVCVTQWVEAK